MKRSFANCFMARNYYNLAVSFCLRPYVFHMASSMAAQNKAEADQCPPQFFAGNLRHPNHKPVPEP